MQKHLEFCMTDAATTPPRDSLRCIFRAIDLLSAIRAPRILSGMRCGSALFSSKVLSVRGLCVLWSRLQMSQMSVRNVALNLLLVLSVSHCPQVPFQ